MNSPVYKFYLDVKYTGRLFNAFRRTIFPKLPTLLVLYKDNISPKISPKISQSRKIHQIMIN